MPQKSNVQGALSYLYSSKIIFAISFSEIGFGKEGQKLVKSTGKLKDSRAQCKELRKKEDLGGTDGKLA